MNRSGAIDSNLSLDTAPAAGDSAVMETIPDLLFYRIDASSNMARFYALSVEPTLFGECWLVRIWGRIGTKGRTIVELHRSREQAMARFAALASAKRRRGYGDA